MIKSTMTVPILLLALSSSGCVEESGQNVEKQSYKGAAISPSTVSGEERAQVLSDRFNLIQTDR